MSPSPAFALKSLDSTAAILLRKTRFSDTSLIVTWYSLKEGKLKTMAKGALRPKSRFAGALDLFYVCEISIARSLRSDLHTLREVEVLDARTKLRSDYASVALASYFVELLDLVTEAHHADEEVYGLLFRALNYLDQKVPNQRALHHFENELARMLGIQQPGVTAIMAIGRTYHQIPFARANLLKTLPES